MVQPLDKITWGWQGNKSALWWLFLLYRDPENFKKASEGLRKRQAFFTAIKLYLHFFPWMLLFIILVRLFLFEVLKVPVNETLLGDKPLWLFHLTRITSGIAGGIAGGIAVPLSLWRAYHYPLHLVFWGMQRFHPPFLFHPVVWDKMCMLPFYRLEKLLVNFAQQQPERAKK